MSTGCKREREPDLPHPNYDEIREGRPGSAVALVVCLNEIERGVRMRRYCIESGEVGNGAEAKICARCCGDWPGNATQAAHEVLEPEDDPLVAAWLAKLGRGSAVDVEAYARLFEVIAEIAVMRGIIPECKGKHAA